MCNHAVRVYNPTNIYFALYNEMSILIYSDYQIVLVHITKFGDAC